MLLNRFSALAAALLVCGPAWSYTTLVQGFSSYYATHGSGSESIVYQYNGPLRLSKVSINWEGAAGGEGDNPWAEFADQDSYTVDYAGVVGFFSYTPDYSLFGPGDSQEVSDSTDCSIAYCSYAIFGGGTFDVDPALFSGNSYFIFDSQSSVGPGFDQYEESFFESEASGTVTFYLSAAPEPASWAMMLTGFGAIGGAMRSRRKAAVTFA